MKVAYQGVPGAYSEAASVEFFGEDVNLIPCPSFEKLVETLVSGEADRASMPIENSLAGTIHGNLDKLVANEGVHIVGELDFRVRHCLMIGQGKTLEDIKEVYSHPMALAQCEKYLRSKKLLAVEGFDTAGSARMLRDGDLPEKAGAIASRRAVDLYGLQLVEANIEDDSENYTRFLILSLQPTSPSRGVPYKTSIAFTMINSPGVLWKALSIFSALDLDMTKIESRHVRSLDTEASGEEAAGKKGRWGYIFYVDIACDYSDETNKAAFDLLQKIT